MHDVRALLLDGLTTSQRAAVCSPKRRVLIIAGAGAGKTEVMARRIAWWTAVEGAPKDGIVAFTFTNKAAEEMNFRIRGAMQRVVAPGQDATLGGMYVGTIHSFCLQRLRELDPDTYHNFEVLDDVGRLALVEQGFRTPLELDRFHAAIGGGSYWAIEQFLKAYDLLHEFDAFDVAMPASVPPGDPRQEVEWCAETALRAAVGGGRRAQAFAAAAARYYAFLRCRRFLDFSTSQTELLRLLRDPATLAAARARASHLVVDEVQDTNPVQDALIRRLVGGDGALTAVGDHRQAIFGFRGGRVELMAELHGELSRARDGAIVELAHNFRSTPRIIALANSWQGTIGAVGGLASPEMRHGDARRVDDRPSHVAAIAFDDRADEAEWIAGTITQLVRPDGTGAFHTTRDGERGLSYGDVAILVRESRDARTYMTALEGRGVPAIFRAGPDLFAQPETLLFLAALARTAGVERFERETKTKSLPDRIKQALGCAPEPAAIIRAACVALRRSGLPLAADCAERLLLATELMRRRIAGEPPTAGAVDGLRTPELREWLARPATVQRVFPQALYHLLLGEAGVAEWEGTRGRGQAAMFHLGQFSALLTKLETPGRVRARDFRRALIALAWWGASKARVEEAPLLTERDAVTITTVHGAKGLEFAAVFLADVVERRFPSGLAQRREVLPFDGPLLERIDPAQLADNENLDGERRLMYVALTRAERYLFVTCSDGEASRFYRDVAARVRRVGGVASRAASAAPGELRHRRAASAPEVRLTTSFSDLRFYLECPHDFYLRKVLGFNKPIAQEFGYGHGVHNLLRAVHTDPRAWAVIARDPARLRAKLEGLVDRGLLYLRYTVGERREKMRKGAVAVLADYVRNYTAELTRMEFEPEREFETLFEEERILVSGAIDIVRRDDPPRVTLIDFKSGAPGEGESLRLDEDLMRLQVGIYGVAVKRELEYEPERGMVRYLAEGDPSKRELVVDLSDGALSDARKKVLSVARGIRERRFEDGPTVPARKQEAEARCQECDFYKFCGADEARRLRKAGKPAVQVSDEE